MFGGFSTLWQRWASLVLKDSLGYGLLKTVKIWPVLFVDVKLRD